MEYIPLCLCILSRGHCSPQDLYSTTLHMPFSTWKYAIITYILFHVEKQTYVKRKNTPYSIISILKQKLKFMSTVICYFTSTGFRVENGDYYSIRGVARVKNPGGQVVMWHVVACRRRPAAPSDLPKSGGAAAPPAPPLATPLILCT